MFEGDSALLSDPTIQGVMGMRLISSLTAVVAMSLVAAGSNASLYLEKDSPERRAAIKKCKDDYEAAQQASKALQGKAKKDALAMAKAMEKQCIANAPRK